MKVLGENFIAKMMAWVMGREVWTSGDGTGSLVIVGRENDASGRYAYAEVYQGIASGDYSHAEGERTNANGVASHAEGGVTTASGDRSHAEGGLTTADGVASHAEGGNTTASGYYSHAEGYNTSASGYFSHAEGAYNVVDPYAIHVVGVGGNGTNMNAETIYYNRGNAKNGYKYLMGVGGYDGRTAVDVTKHKSVQEVIADLTARVEKLEKG